VRPSDFRIILRASLAIRRRAAPAEMRGRKKATSTNALRMVATNLAGAVQSPARRPHQNDGSALAHYRGRCCRIADAMTAIDDGMRAIVERNWPHRRVKLPPPVNGCRRGARRGGAKGRVS